jgi:hypothetical protein
MKTYLEELLLNVAINRAVLAEIEDLSAKAKATAELTPEWLAYRQAHDDVMTQRDILTIAEAAARAEILAEYEHTKNKAPAKGAGVRILRKATYSIVDALAWCRANAPALLVVDEKAFVKADLLGSPIEWIDVPSATLATDLSIYER